MLWSRSFAATLLAGFAVAAAPPSAAQSSDAEMAKYPVKPDFKGKPAAVNLKSHKDANMFRTRLREAAAQGPNFAGHMTVATWGCGTSCQTVALVDARSGKVYFGPTASVGVKHRIDSRLLVVNPPETFREAYGGSPPDGVETEYYLWDNAKLTRVKR